MLQPSRYLTLPERFYARVSPTPVASPRVVKLNTELADQLGLGSLDEAAATRWFSGNEIPPGTTSLAAVYAGHQFGHFVPQLGDGRAVLLGDACDVRGICFDVELKGSGRTPYSRSGDGRAAVGPVLREYVVSEAMHALGIPTTRSLAAVTTGESVFREDVLPGAVLTRVAASHVRVGTFEFFAAQADNEALRSLADYVIERHYPHLASVENRYLALLSAVIDRQAHLVSSWMLVGFVHGVMNTDNMAISGETIDFGPCAFLDAYDPAAVFSSIDRHGRYAYANQPNVAAWNLARFAETLLPMLDSDEERAITMAAAEIASFSANFSQRWLNGMRRKLGLRREEVEDASLAGDWLALLHESRADFTLSFRALCDAAACDTVELAVDSLQGLGADRDQLIAWTRRWYARLSMEGVLGAELATTMRRSNPYVIPRNHRIEQVIQAAVERQDYTPFETLSRALAMPFEQRDDWSDYTKPPLPDERVWQTFCGT